MGVRVEVGCGSVCMSLGNVVHSQLHSDHNVYILYRSDKYCYIDQVTYVLKFLTFLQLVSKLYSKYIYNT